MSHTTGSLIQLSSNNNYVTTDNNTAPNFIYDNPEITIFKNRFRRHINFAKAEQEIPIAGNMNFGKTITCQISKLADYINKLTLVIELPELYCIYKKWTNYQMEEYLKNYGITYTYDINNKFDFLTNDDFMRIVGEITIDPNTDIWTRTQPGIISTFIDELNEKKSLINNILEILGQYNDSQLINMTLQDFIEDLYIKLFNLYEPDSNKNLACIISYLSNYIKDELPISTFTVNFQNIISFCNLFCSNLSNGNYVISTNTPNETVMTKSTLYDGMMSWYNNYIIESSGNNFINDDKTFINPDIGTIINIKDGFSNMPNNFLKNYCNMDKLCNGFIDFTKETLIEFSEIKEYTDIDEINELHVIPQCQDMFESIDVEVVSEIIPASEIQELSGVINLTEDQTVYAYGVYAVHRTIYGTYGSSAIDLYALERPVDIDSNTQSGKIRYNDALRSNILLSESGGMIYFKLGTLYIPANIAYTGNKNIDTYLYITTSFPVLLDPLTYADVNNDFINRYFVFTSQSNTLSFSYGSIIKYIYGGYSSIFIPNDNTAPEIANLSITTYDNNNYSRLLMITLPYINYYNILKNAYIHVIYCKYSSPDNSQGTMQKLLYNNFYIYNYQNSLTLNLVNFVDVNNNLYCNKPYNYIDTINRPTINFSQIGLYVKISELNIYSPPVEFNKLIYIHQYFIPVNDYVNPGIYKYNVDRTLEPLNIDLIIKYIYDFSYNSSNNQFFTYINSSNNVYSIKEFIVPHFTLYFLINYDTSLIEDNSSILSCYYKSINTTEEINLTYNNTLLNFNFLNIYGIKSNDTSIDINNNLGLLYKNNVYKITISNIEYETLMLDLKNYDMILKLDPSTATYIFYGFDSDSITFTNINDHNFNNFYICYINNLDTEKSINNSYMINNNGFYKIEYISESGTPARPIFTSIELNDQYYYCTFGGYIYNYINNNESYEINQLIIYKYVYTYNFNTNKFEIYNPLSTNVYLCMTDNNDILMSDYYYSFTVDPLTLSSPYLYIPNSYIYNSTLLYTFDKIYFFNYANGIKTFITLNENTYYINTNNIDNTVTDTVTNIELYSNGIFTIYDAQNKYFIVSTNTQELKKYAFIDNYKITQIGNYKYYECINNNNTFNVNVIYTLNNYSLNLIEYKPYKYNIKCWLNNDLSNSINSIKYFSNNDNVWKNYNEYLINNQLYLKQNNKMNWYINIYDQDSIICNVIIIEDIMVILRMSGSPEQVNPYNINTNKFYINTSSPNIPDNSITYIETFDESPYFNALILQLIDGQIILNKSDNKLYYYTDTSPYFNEIQLDTSYLYNSTKLTVNTQSIIHEIINDTNIINNDVYLYYNYDTPEILHYNVFNKILDIGDSYKKSIIELNTSTEEFNIIPSNEIIKYINQSSSTQQTLNNNWYVIDTSDPSIYTNIIGYVAHVEDYINPSISVEYQINKFYITTTGKLRYYMNNSYIDFDIEPGQIFRYNNNFKQKNINGSIPEFIDYPLDEVDGEYIYIYCELLYVYGLVKYSITPVMYEYNETSLIWEYYNNALITNPLITNITFVSVKFNEPTEYNYYLYSKNYVDGSDGLIIKYDSTNNNFINITDDIDFNYYALYIINQFSAFNETTQYINKYTNIWNKYVRLNGNKASYDGKVWRNALTLRMNDDNKFYDFYEKTIENVEYLVESKIPMCVNERILGFTDTTIKGEVSGFISDCVNIASSNKLSEVIDTSVNTIIDNNVEDVVDETRTDIISGFVSCYAGELEFIPVNDTYKNILLYITSENLIYKYDAINLLWSNYTNSLKKVGNNNTGNYAYIKYDIATSKLTNEIITFNDTEIITPTQIISIGDKYINLDAQLNINRTYIINGLYTCINNTPVYSITNININSLYSIIINNPGNYNISINSIILPHEYEWVYNQSTEPVKFLNITNQCIYDDSSVLGTYVIQERPSINVYTIVEECCIHVLKATDLLHDKYIFFEDYGNNKIKIFVKVYNTYPILESIQLNDNYDITQYCNNILCLMYNENDALQYMVRFTYNYGEYGSFGSIISVPMDSTFLKIHALAFTDTKTIKFVQSAHYGGNMRMFIKKTTEGLVTQVVPIISHEPCITLNKQKREYYVNIDLYEDSIIKFTKNQIFYNNYDSYFYFFDGSSYIPFETSILQYKYKYYNVLDKSSNNIYKYNNTNTITTVTVTPIPQTINYTLLTTQNNKIYKQISLNPTVWEINDIIIPYKYLDNTNICLFNYFYSNYTGDVLYLSKTLCIEYNKYICNGLIYNITRNTLNNQLIVTEQSVINNGLYLSINDKILYEYNDGIWTQHPLVSGNIYYSILIDRILNHYYYYIITDYDITRKILLNNNKILNLIPNTDPNSIYMYVYLDTNNQDAHIITNIYSTDQQFINLSNDNIYNYISDTNTINIISPINSETYIYKSDNSSYTYNYVKTSGELPHYELLPSAGLWVISLWNIFVPTPWQPYPINTAIEIVTIVDVPINLKIAYLRIYSQNSSCFQCIDTVDDYRELYFSITQEQKLNDYELILKSGYVYFDEYTDLGGLTATGISYHNDTGKDYCTYNGNILFTFNITANATSTSIDIKHIHVPTGYYKIRIGDLPTSPYTNYLTYQLNDINASGTWNLSNQIIENSLYINFSSDAEIDDILIDDLTIYKYSNEELNQWTIYKNNTTLGPISSITKYGFLNEYTNKIYTIYIPINDVLSVTHVKKNTPSSYDETPTPGYLENFETASYYLKISNTSLENIYTLYIWNGSFWGTIWSSNVTYINNGETNINHMNINQLFFNKTDKKLYSIISNVDPQSETFKPIINEINLQDGKSEFVYYKNNNSVTYYKYKMFFVQPADPPLVPPPLTFYSRHYVFNANIPDFWDITEDFVKCNYQVITYKENTIFPVTVINPDTDLPKTLLIQYMPDIIPYSNIITENQRIFSTSLNNVVNIEFVKYNNTYNFNVYNADITFITNQEITQCIYENDIGEYYMYAKDTLTSNWNTYELSEYLQDQSYYLDIQYNKIIKYIGGTNLDIQLIFPITNSLYENKVYLCILNSGSNLIIYKFTKSKTNIITLITTVIDINNVSNVLSEYKFINTEIKSYDINNNLIYVYSLTPHYLNAVLDTYYLNTSVNLIYKYIINNVITNDAAFKSLTDTNELYISYLLNNNIYTFDGTDINIYYPKENDGIYIENDGYYTFINDTWTNNILIYNITKFTDTIKNYVIQNIAQDTNVKLLFGMKYFYVKNVNLYIGVKTFKEYFEDLIELYIGIPIDSTCYLYNNVFKNYSGVKSINDIVTNIEDIKDMKTKLYDEMNNIMLNIIMTNVNVYSIINEISYTKPSLNDISEYKFIYFQNNNNGPLINCPYDYTNDTIISDNFYSRVITSNNVSYNYYVNNISSGGNYEYNTNIETDYFNVINNNCKNMVNNLYNKFYDPLLSEQNDFFKLYRTVFYENNINGNNVFNSLIENTEPTNLYNLMKTLNILRIPTIEPEPNKYIETTLINDLTTLITNFNDVLILQLDGTEPLDNQLLTTTQINLIIDTITGILARIKNNTSFVINQTLFNIDVYTKINTLTSSRTTKLAYIYLKYIEKYIVKQFIDINVNDTNINNININSINIGGQIIDDINISILDNKNPVEYMVLTYIYNLKNYILYDLSFSNFSNKENLINKIESIGNAYLDSGINNSPYNLNIANPTNILKSDVPELYYYGGTLNNTIIYAEHIFVDQLTSLTSYAINSMIEQYNNFYINIYQDNIYLEQTNPLKECRDYIIEKNNYELNQINFYYDSQENYINKYSYVSQILNKLSDNYKNYTMYNKIINIINTVNTQILKTYESPISLYVYLNTLIYENINELYANNPNNIIINYELFKSMLKNPNYIDPDKGTYDYTITNDVLKYAYKKIWNDLIENINNDILKMMKLSFNQKYIGVFDLMINNYNDRLEILNINPYNQVTQTDKYNWYYEYIINQILFYEGLNNTPSKNIIGYIEYFLKLINVNPYSATYENLSEWYINSFIDGIPGPLDPSTIIYTLIVEQEKIKSVYGIYYEDPLITQKLTPLNLYTVFKNIIETTYNNFETEIDLVKFLIYYLIKGSVFGESSGQLTENALISHRNLTNYYTQALEKINSQLLKIGVYENYHGLTNYSVLEEYVRTLMEKQDLTYIECAWIKEIGHYIIDKIDFLIGDSEIDSITGEYLHILYKTEVPENQIRGYNIMIGNIGELYNYNNKIKPEHTLYIPIKFNFNDTLASALPLVCLQHTDVSIRITLKDFDKLIYYNNEGYVPQLQVMNNKLKTIDKFNKVKKLNGLMIANYIYIDYNYRLELVKHKYENLFEQLKYANDKIINLNEGFEHTVQLNLLGLSKELFILIQPINYINGMLDNGELRYNDYLMLDKYQSYKNPIKSMSIKFNGRVRQDSKAGDYYNLIQKYQHHTMCDNDGVNIYSFALNPEDIQPSGTANMGKIGSLELDIIFDEDLFNYKYDVKTHTIVERTRTEKIVRVAVYSKQYNYLRIMSGMGGLMYVD